VTVTGRPAPPASLDLEVEAALGRVYDPCSLAANNPLSLIDMGLVLGWDFDPHGNLSVRMCVTSSTCLMAPKFLGAARQELEKIEGIGSVAVDVDPSVLWGPELMTDEGKRLERLRHQRSRHVTRARPQQWREQRRPVDGGPGAIG